jgi:hypothetical protein
MNGAGIEKITGQDGGLVPPYPVCSGFPASEFSAVYDIVMQEAGCVQVFGCDGQVVELLSVKAAEPAEQYGQQWTYAFTSSEQDVPADIVHQGQMGLEVPCHGIRYAIKFNVEL